MGYKTKIFREKAETIIKNMKKRNMGGIYCENSKQAVDKILGMIADGALVGLGCSETIIESGLVEALRAKDIRLLDRYREGSHQG